MRKEIKKAAIQKRDATVAICSTHLVEKKCKTTLVETIAMLTSTVRNSVPNNVHLW